MEHRSPRTAAGGLSQRQGMGILFGVYLSFGLSPLYWNLLHGVSALEMVSHRSLWGSLIIAAFMVWKGQFPAFFRAIRDRREIALIGLCSLAHLWNWWIYIWAVTNGKVLECSMGHYIVPMISTILGFLFFRERPGRLQWMGIIFAGIGVLILLMGYGSRPVGLTECVPFRGVVCVLSQTRHGRSRSRYAHGAAVFRAVPVGLPDLAGRKRGRAFPRRRRIHGSAAHRLRIRLRHSPIGPEPRHPQRADDLAGHHAIHFADYGFHAPAAFVMREPTSQSKLLVFLFIWVGVGCFLSGTVFSTGRKKLRQVNGNRAGEVLRNEGGLSPKP